MGKYKETPRNNVISMRISDDERKGLQQIASNHSISISNVMRQAMDIYTRDHEPSTVGHRAI